VTGQDDNLVIFTVNSDDPQQAVQVANAVASEYLRWREELAGEQVRRAVLALQERIQREPVGSQRRTDLQQRLNELQVLESVPSANAVIVERARTAPKTSPAPVRDTLLGAMIGLILALLLVGLREALDTKIRSEEDVEQLLDTPVLATVQSLPRRARLVMFGRNEELYGDAYGLLAANLVQGAGEGTRTIAVTSAIASEGKTSTISNLAVALARRGANVVLADFDVRKPSLAEVFRIPTDAPGVTHLVSGRAGAAEVLWNVSLNGRNIPAATAPGRALTNGGERSKLDGSLSVVPAGSSLRSGSLSQSPHVAPALDDLRRQAGADILLLDTPPALVTVEMAELARNVDAVIVVVRQGRVSRRSLRALARQMHSWRSKLAGAVLTDAPMEERHSYYYRTN
jgi:non-specific protein-tyrosine kinase